MKVKVCGLKYPKNIEAVLDCHPDYVGFIFYDKSPRCGDSETIRYVKNSEINAKKVGVFVNADESQIIESVDQMQLDFVQLHGNETPEYVYRIRKAGIHILKAFGIHDSFEWKRLEDFRDLVSYYLFDTYTQAYGGSGRTFNWSLLDQYAEDIPFFLSGGLGPDTIQEALTNRHHLLAGVDINSKVEIEPGKKAINLVDSIIKTIRNEYVISSK